MFEWKPLWKHSSYFSSVMGNVKKFNGKMPWHLTFSIDHHLKYCSVMEYQSSLIFFSFSWHFPFLLWSPTESIICCQIFDGPKAVCSKSLTAWKSKRSAPNPCELSLFVFVWHSFFTFNWIIDRKQRQKCFCKLISLSEIKKTVGEMKRRQKETVAVE